MAEAKAWRVPEEGLWGFAHCAFYDSWYPWSNSGFAERLRMLVMDLLESGANSFRPQLHWHQVQETVPHGLRSPGDVSDEMVDRLARGEGARWELYDSMVDSLIAAGMVPHLVLGAAYDFQIPSTSQGGCSDRARPDVIGMDSYLGQLYLHARAAARRYRGRVRIWQLENELNCAGETMLLAGWRTGRAWLDSGFLTSVIEVLSRAVREEDPGALTSHNFHTQWRVIKGLYDWRKDVERWGRYIDIVGVDAFPNYLFGHPPMGSRVGKKVAQAREVARGKPVMVLESGYPVRPGYRGMSEGGQAVFVRDAVASTADAGGCGFYYYTLCSPEGYPVEGPWSNRFFQSVEPWWGLVRIDWSRRPAWLEYRKAVSSAKKAVLGRSA